MCIHSQMFYIHVYMNSHFLFFFFFSKKWILEYIQSCNFSAYFSETKHCCCRSVAESWPHGLQPAKLLCPWAFPGKNTGVGWHFLLQGIFPTQGLNPCLLHWQKQSLQMCKCWQITEDELLVPEQGGPDSGCECEIFTAILRGLPALKPELSAAYLSSPASLSRPWMW